jgi:hypothetical protein
VTDLDARYGRRTPRRWIVPIVAALGIAMLIAWAAWTAFQPRPVRAVLWGYEVQSDHRVKVMLDVYRPEPQAVRCTVYAQAEDHTVVGQRILDISPGSAEKTRVNAVIVTERRAVNGVLQDCQPSQ